MFVGLARSMIEVLEGGHRPLILACVTPTGVAGDENFMAMREGPVPFANLHPAHHVRHDHF